MTGRKVTVRYLSKLGYFWKGSSALNKNLYGIFCLYPQVDFDKSKHLTDKAIRKRRLERQRLEQLEQEREDRVRREREEAERKIEEER